MGPNETRNLLGGLYWADNTGGWHSMEGTIGSWKIAPDCCTYMSDKEAKEKKEKEMREQLDKLKRELAKANEDDPYILLAKTKKQKKTFAETPYRIPSEPEKIIKNGPVVIVFWKDKTKTIVRKKPDDPDDIYSAVAQAIMKKWCGSTSHAHKWINKLLVNKEESK